VLTYLDIIQRFMPNLDRYDKKVRPLGPFQELEGVLARSVDLVQ